MPVLRPCLVLMVILTVVTGVLYPLLVTVAAQVAFPDQAGGSLVRDGDTIIGSRLIAQPFTGPEWFWPRPSAVDYKAEASGAGNLAPVAPDLVKTWHDRADHLHAAGVTGTIPADLVTASGSGLDPHLSPAGALAQADRVATARHLDPQLVRALVTTLAEGRQFGSLASPG